MTTLRQACRPVTGGAMCVQRFDDSLIDAVHTTYRNSLRSSSMREPRDPLLKVLIHSVHWTDQAQSSLQDFRHAGGGRASEDPAAEAASHPPEAMAEDHMVEGREGRRSACFLNDPSAGSPTETLLRLLLPLNDQV
jgi:hypothetical protein